MRYLGNEQSKEFHDLERVRPACHVAAITAAGHDHAFAPDTVFQAIVEGYEPCGWCIGTIADLAEVATRPVDSAADLEGRDAGGGAVALRWSYPLDPAAHGIAFDVYSSRDPLDPFRRLALAEHPATEAEVPGFEAGGDAYFTVVARRGALLALPTPTERVGVAAVRAPVTPTGGGAAPGAEGIGFPFAIEASGRVRAEGGDPLLRGKVLQLLLTSPGERVNRPDYGTRLRELVFDPSNEVLAAATEFTAVRSLRRYLGDQIEVDSVRVTNAGAELRVDVVYVRAADLRTQQLRVGLPIPG